MAVQAPDIRQRIVGVDVFTRVMRRLPFAALAQRIRSLRGGFDRLRQSAVMTRIVSGFRTMRNSLAGIGRQVGGLLGPWSALFGVGAAAGLAALTARFASHGDAIAKTARALGVATGSYQAYLFAAGQSGVDTGKFATAMRGLRTAIRQVIDSPDGNVAQIFADMGVNLRGANGGLRDQFAILRDIMPVFEEMRAQGKETEAGVLAEALFGRAGLEFTNFLSLSQDELQSLIDTAAEVGAIIPEDELANAERMTDILGELGAAGKNVTAAIGSMITEEFGDDLQFFARWLVDNRQQIANWVSDVVSAVGTAGRSFANFLFGPQQFDDFGRHLGRAGGFVETMTNVLTPIAQALQGIVDLVGGWENALLIIAGLFAFKLVAGVFTFVAGIAQVGFAITAMVGTGVFQLGRLIAQFAGLRTAATTTAAATSGVMGTAGAGAGAGLIRSTVGGAARVLGLTAIGGLLAEGADRLGLSANPQNSIFAEGPDDEHSPQAIARIQRENSARDVLETQGGFSSHEVDLMQSVPGILSDRFGDGVDTIAEAAAVINGGADTNMEAAEMMRRALESPPQGQVDINVTVDAEGRSRSVVTTDGEAVGRVTANQGVDTPAWSLRNGGSDRTF